jgi:alkylation response protein AidB-like acyl-CoA dehydrogenase
MKLSFEPDQLALRDAVRDLLRKECTPDVVRKAWEAPAGELDRGVWDALADMGVLSVLVPEADGGLGLDFTSLVLVLEETGRVALPHPIVDTAAVAAPLAGADGALVAACLGGAPVPCADDADRFLVDHEGALLMLPRDGVQLRSLDTVDRSRRLAQLIGVNRSVATVITESATALEDAFDRGVLGASAQLLGLAQTMLDLTVGYVKERHQFGVPIGSFQAVKHHLADALKALEFARPTTYRAAWSVANGSPDRRRDVAMAKAMASDAAQLVGRTALQCHGAIGYTVEYDLHLYLKRTWALARSWGDAAWHRDRVATYLGV